MASKFKNVPKHFFVKQLELLIQISAIICQLNKAKKKCIKSNQEMVIKYDTISCWVPFFFGKVGSQNGIVESVEVDWHRVITLVVVPSLKVDKY